MHFDSIPSVCINICCVGSPVRLSFVPALFRSFSFSLAQSTAAARWRLFPALQVAPVPGIRCCCVRGLSPGADVPCGPMTAMALRRLLLRRLVLGRCVTRRGLFSKSWERTDALAHCLFHLSRTFPLLALAVLSFSHSIPLIFSLPSWLVLLCMKACSCHPSRQNWQPLTPLSPCAGRLNPPILL